MSTIDSLPSAGPGGPGRLPSPWWDNAPAWLTSLALHMALLAVLASCWMWIPLPQTIFLAASPIEPDTTPLPEEFHFAVEPQTTVGIQSTSGFDAARAAALHEQQSPKFLQKFDSVAPVGEIQAPQADHTVLEAPRFTEATMIKGAGSVGTSGADGAIDRITQEILLSLEERPTLVVWLFDQSGSLKDQRETIARRFDRVYRELGTIRAAGSSAFSRHDDKPLLTIVASFGAKVELITRRPTDNVELIKASVRAVEDDASGVENVFHAISQVADQYRLLRVQSPRRNVMIVVFTDEAGDDAAQLDATVHLCRKNEMPVYVVGVPAPFGRPDAYVRYVDPDPNFDQRTQWLPVHQGPESPMPEALQLGFIGQRKEDAAIDSGFGPFGLCRLAYETGGLYFVVHPNREVGRHISPWETAGMVAYISEFFDPKLMRSYRPDYVSLDEYGRLLAQNEALAALVEASQLSWLAQLEGAETRFPKFDEADFVRNLTVAQRTAARIEPQIRQMVETLRRGETQRPQLTKLRWRAGYDLAMGRALAAKVRTEGYNAMLARAKQGMQFEDPRNNTWRLQPSQVAELTSAMARDAAEARKFLERVVADHQGTPWASLAQRDLDHPIGWTWREEYTEPPRRTPGGNIPGPRSIPKQLRTPAL